MRFNTTIRKLHLWLGISSGLLVFVIAITGCLYAFQEEILNATQPFRFVESQNKPYLPPSKLQAIAQHELPDKLLHSIKFNVEGKAAEAIFYHYEPTYYYTIYLNPNNGDVLKVNDNEAGFFRFVLNGHFFLWLPPQIGQPLVASVTLVFVVLLITGLILWFPRELFVLKQSVLFVWRKNTHWRRKNFDLHNVLGYYAGFFALIIALTGLIWGFQWFANGVYKSAGGEKSLTYYDPGSRRISSGTKSLESSPIDSIWIRIQHEYPGAKSIEVHPPESDSSSIAANANIESDTYWKIDYRYFNQYTLEEISVNHIYGRFQEANVADKMMRMNYDIHVGAIGGLAGKVFVFLIGLVVASLPITGFIIWWGKRKKNKPGNK